jgi:hypothetical protein
MSNTFKMITIVGTSPESYKEAIDNALSDTSATVRNLSWFEVKEFRGRIADGKVAEYQVNLQIGFRVEVP